MAVMTPIDQLRMMVDADHDPLLTIDELHTLLLLNTRVKVYSYWESGAVYAVGNRVTPNPRNGQTYIVTTAGTSGVVQPAFADDTSLTDNDVVWEVSDEDDAYNLRQAAAEGWRIKAGRAASRYDLKTDNSSTARSQLYKHCMDMYKSYKRGQYGSVPVTNPYVTI